jgi:type I restriction enzyme S subunit
LTEDWRDAHSISDLFESQEAEYRLDVPANWIQAKLDDLSTKITDGEHLSPKTVSSGIPMLSAKDVRETGVLLDDCKFVTEGDSRKFRKRCDPELDDVLIVSRGATVGRTALVDTDQTFCLMGSVILVRTKECLSNKFLGFFLKSRAGQDQLLEASGSTAQQAIYIRDIRNAVIPVPPIEEQHEIVRRVEALFKLADAIEHRVAAAQARADRLTQSILAKAFRGELVPTEAELARQEGREYEPASVLLERIRTERRASATPPNGSRKRKTARRRT